MNHEKIVLTNRVSELVQIIMHVFSLVTVSCVFHFCGASPALHQRHQGRPRRSPRRHHLHEEHQLLPVVPPQAAQENSPRSGYDTLHGSRSDAVLTRCKEAFEASRIGEMATPQNFQEFRSGEETAKRLWSEATELIKMHSQHPPRADEAPTRIQMDRGQECAPLLEVRPLLVI